MPTFDVTVQSIFRVEADNLQQALTVAAEICNGVRKQDEKSHAIENEAIGVHKL